LKENPGYFSWIQNADFPLYTKRVLTAIRLKNFNK
jgi:DNA polymerase-3 subunit epsilon